MNDSSEVDFRAMENLFNHGHHVWALFIFHLVIEKLLKAHYVKNVDISVPPIHDLTKSDFDETNPYIKEIIESGERII